MPTQTKEQRLQDSRIRASEAARLCQAGLYRCGGKCRKVKPIEEGIVTFYGGTVLFGICPECFGGCPVVMKEKDLAQGGQGIWVGPLREEDRPADIRLASDIPSCASDLFHQAAAKKRKIDL